LKVYRFAGHELGSYPDIPVDNLVIEENASAMSKSVNEFKGKIACYLASIRGLK